MTGLSLPFSVIRLWRDSASLEDVVDAFDEECLERRSFVDCEVPELGP